MKRMRRKAGSILLTAAMFLSLFPAGALDAEPQEAPPQTCTCTVLCTEEAADTLCPVCAEDITRCTGKAAEPQQPEQPQEPEVPECTCTVLCTEETMDAQCPACAAGVANCTGKAAEPQQPEQPQEPEVPECTCTVLCTEEAMDAQCPACAAGVANCTGKAAEPQEPEQPQEPEVPKCTCTVLCTEDAVDTLCPACAEDITGCTGEPASHPPITLAPNAADVIYVSDGGTGDGSSEASCADFETAMQNAQEGDTFIVVGSVDLTSGTWKTPACSITVAGADASASLKLFGKQIRSSSSPITSAVPAISLQGDIIFDDIILECTMSNSYYSFIYAVVANGNHLTLEDGVSVKWGSSGTQRQIHFYGGGFQEDVAGDTHLTIKTSKLSRHHIYGGGYNGDVQGDTLVEFAGTAGSYIGCSSVYGGGYAVGSSETANVSGTSRLQFEYYTPNASMFAGGYADGGTANVGSTQSDLLESEADGSALVRFYGGGYACNGGTANVEGNVSSHIEDRAVYSYGLDKNSRFLYNGGYADATSYAEVLGNAVMEVARQQSFQCSGGGRGPNTTIHGDTSISVQDSKNFWSFGCGDSAGADSVLGDITLTYQNTYGAIFTLGYTQKDTDKDTVGLPGSGSEATINLNGYTSGSNLHIHNGAHGYSLQRYWYDHSVPTTINVRNHNNVKNSSGGAINLTPQDQIQIMSGGTLEGQPPFYGNSFPVFSYTDERKTGSVTIDEGGTLALKEDEHIAGSLTVNGTLSVQDSKKLSVDGGVSTGTSAAFATNNYVADRVFLQANSTQTASFASGNSAFDVAQRAGTGGFGQEWYLKQAQVKHIITASAGPNGTITPEGAVEVPEGANQTFHITPKPGYHIQDVLVDGTSVGAVSEYTFPPSRPTTPFMPPLPMICPW